MSQSFFVNRSSVYEKNLSWNDMLSYFRWLLLIQFSFYDVSKFWVFQLSVVNTDSFGQGSFSGPGIISMDSSYVQTPVTVYDLQDTEKNVIY